MKLWHVLVFGVAGFLIVAAIWGAFGFNTKPPLKDRKALVENKIAAELPLGSSPERVWSFMKSVGVQSGYKLYDAADTPDPTPPSNAAYNTGGPMNEHERGPYGLTSSTIQLEFYFDKKKRLIGSAVWESATGF